MLPFFLFFYRFQQPVAKRDISSTAPLIVVAKQLFLTEISTDKDFYILKNISMGWYFLNLVQNLYLVFHSLGFDVEMANW